MLQAQNDSSANDAQMAIYNEEAATLANYITIYGMFEKRNTLSYEVRPDANDDLFTWIDIFPNPEINKMGLAELGVDISYVSLRGSASTNIEYVNRIQFRLNNTRVEQDGYYGCRQRGATGCYLYPYLKISDSDIMNS